MKIRILLLGLLLYCGQPMYSQWILYSIAKDVITLAKQQKRAKKQKKQQETQDNILVHQIVGEQTQQEQSSISSEENNKIEILIEDNAVEVPKENDDITLVVSAMGQTTEEATKMALRSAIEQAYGTFVSANTTILNDELVKDEIVTLSLGNIKSYKELSSEVLPNNNVFITLQATVSISKLVNYAQNKGAEAEFAGATFAMNLKIEELNTRSEEKIIANTLSAIEKLYMIGFDYKISISNVQADGQVTAEIDAYANINGQKAYELFYNTLENISLNQNKIDEYAKLKKKVYTVSFYEKGLPKF